MIVEQQAGLYAGFQACIRGAIEGGCRAYFASPSPLHAQLLNEGARRFPESHGTFVQAAHPVEALSMALGTAQAGLLPLVSAHYPDFLAMQEVLQQACQQELPMVLALLLYQAPPFAGASPLAYPYPCFMAPWPASGLPLLNLMPASLSQLYQLTQEACSLALHLRQPVVLLLDPHLLNTMGTLHPSLAVPLEPLLQALPRPELRWPDCALARQQQLHTLASRWLQHWPCEGERRFSLLATGALGGWVLDLDWPEASVLVPESLCPLGLDDLWQQDPPAEPVYVLECAPSQLSWRLQQRFPHVDIRALSLDWYRAIPLDLQVRILEAMHALV
ncbi:MAG: hypothetical protein IGS03_15405 [Candidatus Sericytochromatia bacterium]|nr:hypothetical protein [Candidatus Sericytochromatia bacterium]